MTKQYMTSQACLAVLQQILLDTYYFTIRYWFTAQNWASFLKSLIYYWDTWSSGPKISWFSTVWLFLWSLCSKNAGMGLLLVCLVKHKTSHLFQAIKLLKITFSKIPLYSPWINTMDNLFLSLPSCFWTRTQHVLFTSTLAWAPTTFPWYASASTAGFIRKRRKKAQVLTSSRKKTNQQKSWKSGKRLRVLKHVPCYQEGRAIDNY